MEGQTSPIHQHVCLAHSDVMFALRDERTAVDCRWALTSAPARMYRSSDPSPVETLLWT